MIPKKGEFANKIMPSNSKDSVQVMISKILTEGADTLPTIVRKDAADRII